MTRTDADGGASRRRGACFQASNACGNAVDASSFLAFPRAFAAEILPRRTRWPQFLKRLKNCEIVGGTKKLMCVSQIVIKRFFFEKCNITLDKSTISLMTYL